MTTLYVREQGAVIRRTGERLVVTKEGEVLQDTPIIHVDQVVVMGNIQVTTPAVALLLEKDVDVVYLSSRGKFRGRLVTTGSRFAHLRHVQLRVLEDVDKALTIAKAVVSGKLSNQATLLQQHPRADKFDPAIARIGRARRQTKQAAEMDTLRGYEGSAGAAYFGALREVIPQDWGFSKRAYHPPPDPVNALLSLGYTLLLKDMTAAVQLVGLDPYLGFFHALEYGRPSLTLDLMEPFRPLVDGLVLRLIGEGEIQRAQFKAAKRNGAASVVLEEAALQHYLRAYEDVVAQRVSYAQTGERTTLRRCMELQARELAQVLLNKRQTFRPFKMS